MAATHVRTGLVIGTAAAIAVIGLAVVFLLDARSPREGDSTPPAATGAVEDRAPATIEPAPSPGEAPGPMGPPDAGYPDGERTPKSLPPMGIDSVAFEWTVSPVLAASGGEAWIHQLLEIDGTLWAIGSGYDMARDREQWFVYTSEHGVEWQRGELPADVYDAGHAQISAFDGGIVAVVNPWDSDSASPQLSVFVSSDGETWTRRDPSPSVPAGEQVWINHVAGAQDVLVLAGAHAPVMDEPHEAPLIVIEHDGYVIELDEMTWSYLITDAATGVVVGHGSQEHIWSQADGVTGIYDPVADEVVFPLSWEDLDRAATAAYDSVAWDDRMLISVTSADRTLTLDEFTGAATVTDASGGVLFEGSERDLFQGPPPTFRDRDGNVIVIVPWDLWESAHAAAYGEPGVEYTPTPVLLRSADLGTSWQAVDIDGLVDENFYFQTLVGGNDGFLAIGSSEPPYEEFALRDVPAPIVLRSTDGLEWTATDTNLDGLDWLNNVTVVDDGYLAVRGTPGGQSEVIASDDGAVWTPVLTQDALLLEVGQVWFDRAAGGPLGTFVTGSYDGHAVIDPAPAHITRDGRTLTVIGTEFTVTDDTTGETLFTFDERVAMYHEEAIGAPAEGFRWGHGGLVMFDEDGGVIFAVSHRRYEEAMSEAWDDPSTFYEMKQVLFFSDGPSWAQVPMPGDIGAHPWVSGIIVTDDRVIMTITSESHTDYDYSVECVALVGVPAP